MKRITDSQVIKHKDGGFHEQLYCFGHLWGPAYFKEGSKDYEEYISIVQRLKLYEDTGLEPKEIEELIKQAITNCYLVNLYGIDPGMEEGMCAGLRTMDGRGESCDTCQECRLQYQYAEEHS